MRRRSPRFVGSLLWSVYLLGVFVVGGVLAAAAVWVIAGGGENATLPALIGGIVAGLVAVWLTQFLLILETALSGSWLLLLAGLNALALRGQGLVVHPVQHRLTP